VPVSINSEMLQKTPRMTLAGKLQSNTFLYINDFHSPMSVDRKHISTQLQYVSISKFYHQGAVRMLKFKAVEYYRLLYVGVKIKILHIKASQNTVS
jgi:hypothetical protein